MYVPQRVFEGHSVGDKLRFVALLFPRIKILFNHKEHTMSTRLTRPGDELHPFGQAQISTPAPGLVGGMEQSPPMSVDDDLAINPNLVDSLARAAEHGIHFKRGRLPTGDPDVT